MSRSGRGGLRWIVRRYPVGAFLILTFVISWAPFAFGSSLSEEDFSPFSALLAFGPLLAGLLLLAAGGREEWRAWRKRVLRWRVGASWYAVVFLGPPLIFFGGTILYSLTLGESLPLTAPGFTVAQVLFAVAATFLGAPILEELAGWRGYLLPKLLAGRSALLSVPLVSSVVIGVPWSIWHFPEILFPGLGVPAPDLESIAYSIVFATALSVIMTWVYLGTGGSVLLAGLGLHFTVNLTEYFLSSVVDLPGSPFLRWTWAACLLAVVAGVLLKHGLALGGDRTTGARPERRA